MPTYTKNLKLQKPLQEEFYDIEVINANSEKIDTAIGNKVDKIDGKGLSTNDYTNEEKEKLATLQSYNDSGLRLELDKKADKTTVYTKQEMDTKLTEQKKHTDTHRNYTLTHTKLGTVHTLTDLPTGQGIYQCQFIAQADYTEGDTFTGYTAKPTGEETTLPDKAFVKGDIVSITVDTVHKKLGFDISSKIDNVISIYQYSKSGITHNLIGKGNNIQFIPTSDFVNGNTIKVNEVTVTPFNNLGKVLEEPFKANIIQNATIQGNKLVFKVGGGGDSLQPKITVSSSQPSSGKMGDFWVKDSGYVLQGVVAQTYEPSNIQNNSLFVFTGFGPTRVKFVDSKKYVLESYIKYAKVYKNYSWIEPQIFIYNGSWQDISATSNRLFVIASSITDSGERRTYLAEYDPKTLSYIRKVTENASEYCELGGISNRLFLQRSSTLYELDLKTGSTINSRALDKSRRIGGTSKRLFATTGDKNTPFMEIDPETLLIIRYSYEASTDYWSWVGIGGTRDTLFVSTYGQKTYDNDYIARVDLSNLTTYNKKSTYVNSSSPAIDGTSDQLFTISNCRGNCRGREGINLVDPDTFSQVAHTSVDSEVHTIGATK